MIDRQHGKLIMTCETCDNDQEFGEDFSEMITEAKALGWKMQKNPQKEWEHFCPVCSDTRYKRR